MTLRAVLFDVDGVLVHGYHARAERQRRWDEHMQADLGIGYLIITHNLPVVRRVSALVAIMYLGRLVERGPTAVVFARPAHPYTLALRAATPKPDPALRRTELELKGEIPSLANRPRGCEFHTRCPFAQPRCLIEPPALRELAPGHFASCHFPFHEV